ncbi:uncharacterized protein LOC136076955 [Hydra vulgaris]|uniref:Uncharacterized protein LOC136076955 n=1 Tax=Hydra vulgaris TaxID=6087 RepID=A0ABM4BDR1_HYDVU
MEIYKLPDCANSSQQYTIPQFPKPNNIGLHVNNSQIKIVVPSISHNTSRVLSEDPFNSYNNIMDFLNIEDGIVSLKYPNFVLTNSHYLDICKEKDKHDLTWQNLSVFFTSYCKYPITGVMLAKCLKKSKDHVAKLNRAKHFTLKNSYLSSVLSFCPEVPELSLLPSDNCSINTSGNSCEFVTEDVSAFQSCITPTSIGVIEHENLVNNSANFDFTYKIKKYKRRIDYLKLKNRQLNRKCSEFKRKYQAILLRYSVRNVNKRGARKDCRINQLLQINLRLEKEIDMARKRSQSDRQEAWYLKKKIENAVPKTSDEMNDSILKESLNYFENLTEELKERVDIFEKNVVEVFEGGKYNDEIRSVYYNLLSKNVSVNNVESVIRTVLQKMVGISCGALPKKSLAAEFFSEMNLLSKAQVREAMLNSTNNVLHTDGTKYNFREVGSFQVTTLSGSYTFGIEDMFSGEAQSYFGELKNLLTDMSQIFSPEKENYEDDLKKLIFSFKSLMTDRTIVNSSFFSQFQHWRKAILPFVVENYDKLPLNEKLKTSQMHHVFCGLHIIHNLGIYAEKAIIEWEKVVEQEGSIHGGFKNAQNSRTFDILYELSKLTTY